MDNTRTGERDGRDRSDDAGAPGARAQLALPAAELASGRIWLCVNLLAAGAVVATFWPTAPNGLLVGWSSFAVLNVLLQLVHEADPRGVRHRRAGAGPRAFAVLLGLCWGSGVMLLLPYAADSAPGLLLGAVLAIALFAVPIFGDRGNAYAYFLLTLLALSLAALIREPRFHFATPWLVVTACALFINATVYHRPLARLRASLNRLVGIARGEPAARRGPYDTDQDLIRAAESQFAELERQLSARRREARVLGALGDAILTTDTHGQVDYLNPVAEVLLGWDLAHARGKAVEHCLRIVVPPEQHNRARELFEASRLTQRVQSGGDDAELLRRDGVVYGIDFVVTPIRDDTGEFLGSSFVVRDVTERRHRTESIAWRATHDPLTGTINRAEFEQRLKQLLRRTREHGDHSHTLLFIDIDHFKFINDSYGHAAGDIALKSLAELLRSRIRGADTLARVGGDEFAAVLYSCGAEKARLIADGLRAAVERHEFRWNAIDLPVTISVGIVEFDRDSAGTSEIMHAADSACYGAKVVGRNRVHQFNEGVVKRQTDEDAFTAVKEVQAALHGNRLELFHQVLTCTHPTLDARRCELSAAVRRQNGEFIPRADLTALARRFHLNADIDRWVTKAAVDALRLDHPTLRDMHLVLVPLSRLSIADERVRQYVLDTMRDNTELCARVGFKLQDWEDDESPRHFIAALKQLGCSIMVEDAGFGSRGIELIKSLGADFLGIRGTLIQNVMMSSADYEAVLGLIRIARSLGMRSVAESVDSRSLRDTLAAMGVDLVKGELDGGPRPVSLTMAQG